MKLTTIAALAAVLLALSACANEDIDYLTALAVGEPVPDYAAGSLTIAEIIEDEDVLRMIGPEGSGPMGEEIWTGPGCYDVFRVRICE